MSLTADIVRSEMGAGSDTYAIAVRHHVSEAVVWNVLAGKLPDACRQPEACKRVRRGALLCRSCHMAQVRESPEAVARREAARERAIQATIEANIARAARAWCPPEREAEYRLFRDKVGAAEARRIIEDDIARRRTTVFLEAAE